MIFVIKYPYKNNFKGYTKTSHVHKLFIEKSFHVIKGNINKLLGCLKTKFLS